MTTSAADRLLQTFLGLTLVLVAAGAAFALYFIGQDAGESGEFLDGLGTMIGLAILVLVGVPGVLAGLALSRSVRHRPHARGLAVAAGLVGLCSVAVLAFAYHPFVAAAVPLVLVVVTAVGARGEGDRFAA